MSYTKLYDTTLRDGLQNPHVHFTTEGKLEALRLLDRLGVDYIEAGFPQAGGQDEYCLLYTSPSPRDRQKSRMPSSA